MLFAAIQLYNCYLRKRIFGRVGERLRLIVGNILHAEVTEHLIQRLAKVAERDRAVGIIL